MQLKLKVGLGESLSIDVKPGDTFQDLSEKLYQIGGIHIDLSQLKSEDKPIDMNTNVIQYFSEKGSNEKVKIPKLCRLCSRDISHDPHYLFDRPPSGPSLAEKVNTSLPLCVSVANCQKFFRRTSCCLRTPYFNDPDITIGWFLSYMVSKRDLLPKQICSVCFKSLNTNYEFFKKVINAQKTLENVYSIKTKSFNSDGCCPLCMVGRFRSHDKKVLVTNDPIQTAIKKDLEFSAIKSEPLSPGEGSSSDVFDNDEVVSEFWDGTFPNSSVELFGTTSVSSPSHTGERRYKKRSKTDDDGEWTIEEEYLPVSRRGRPRGAKNKPKPVIKVLIRSCMLCSWHGAETDVLHHAINQHCQPDRGYFRCPLCKENQPNEMVLENHINNHRSV